LGLATWRIRSSSRSREGVELLELRPVFGIDGIDRLPREGEAVGDDENDEEDVDDAAHGMGFAADLQMS
jgi:hypothetical protein